ncbi:hypothetical protein DICVIV_05182 [Dictyocaulus viviparus]|uniref:Uncharacterized protein n=1 Tax=Dictyocaulus viviparus TaxID=29172 RepID=A0A0D8Y2D2_DICVI|nr:hypothetical protein DICVIV_05182 [Dictyocaulus viviparus]
MFHRSNVEEFSTNSGRFEEKPPVKSNNDNEWIIEKFENPESFTRKLTKNDDPTSVTSTSAEPSTTTTTTTGRPTNRLIASAHRSTGTTMLSTKFITTMPSITSSTPAEDIEYELVEVEIDEDGNEIVSEPITVTEPSNSDSTGRHGDEIDSLINIDNKPEQLQRKSLAEKTKYIHIDELQARRKLVQQQKRALNLPDNVEVEYVDGDQQTQSTNDRVVNTDDNIDTEDYSDEKRA